MIKIINENLYQRVLRKSLYVGALTHLIPFTVGLLFVPKAFFGFALGSIVVGFFLTTSSTLTAGLLEALRASFFSAGQQSKPSGTLGRAMAWVKKDRFGFFSVLVQNMSVQLVIFYFYFDSQQAKFSAWVEGGRLKSGQ